MDMFILIQEFENFSLRSEVKSMPKSAAVQQLRPLGLILLLHLSLR